MERGEITVGRGHGEGARRLPEHRRRRGAHPIALVHRPEHDGGDARGHDAEDPPQLPGREVRLDPGDITARTKARVAAVALAVK